MLVSLVASWLVLGGAPAVGATPWREVVEQLEARCRTMATALESAREALLVRAAGDPAALERLRGEQVVLRPPGYGVLPEVLDSLPLSPVTPTEKRYSLESLPAEFAHVLEGATRLARRVEEDGAAPLDRLIERFETLREDLETFEEHVGYHGYWQQAVGDYPRFFARHNAVVAEVREIAAAARDGAPAAEASRRYRAIVAKLAPFRATLGLGITVRADGTRVLPLALHTDIDDTEFLEAFRAAIEDEFVRSAAARELRFALELQLVHVRPQDLYPEGAPAPGSPIDAAAHVARFPRRALVLTTGEESTHAFVGRAVVLGPAAIRKRTLAHEFAHLLGFGDAYLRGFEPARDPRYGVVLVEWTGLRDDLMGNAKGGRLTAEMIEMLLEAYAPPAARGRPST